MSLFVGRSSLCRVVFIARESDAALIEFRIHFLTSLLWRRSNNSYNNNNNNSDNNNSDNNNSDNSYNNNSDNNSDNNISTSLRKL